MANPPYKWISQRVRVREDRRFLTGQGRYVGDIRLAGMLEVAVLASPYAHALIKSIDVEDAIKQPGVVLAITGADLARDTDPIPQFLDLPRVRWYSLATDRVRFAGEGVAAVVATSRAAAEDALDFIKVEYEPLPALADPEAAMAPGAPVLHPDHGSNIAWQGAWTWGDVDGDFRRADRVVKTRLRWSRHSGVPLETFGTVAAWNSRLELLDVWASHQAPALSAQISTVLRFPSNRIRIHADLDVGGSYGAKRGQKQIALTTYLAMRTRRPLRYLEDRLENMAAGDGHGPDRVFDAELALSRTGECLSLRLHTVDDVGAYVGRGPLQIAKCITAIVGPYRIGSVRYSGLAVMTNKTNQNPYRGFGQSPHNFVLERLMDMAATELGLDRVEIRRRNLIPPEAFPYLIPSGSRYDSGDYPAVLDKALALAAYPNLLRFQAEARSQGRCIGIGIAACIEPSGANTAFFALMNPKHKTSLVPEGARVGVDSRGKITVAIGFASTGQSHETMVSQVIAEVMDIAPEEVAVIRADSLAGIPSVPPTGSRMSLMLSGAVLGAAQKILAKMKRKSRRRSGDGRVRRRRFQAQGWLGRRARFCRGRAHRAYPQAPDAARHGRGFVGTVCDGGSRGGTSAGCGGPDAELSGVHILRAYPGSRGEPTNRRGAFP
ncbi:MAG: xanthine dehydrogenase family protein molybdopterin-binding subunit [Betaproteobacteria bacterium]|nr:xanthine dehydrogenase family protein molybdopterin-binding subunit [Betaproteobacteria bacterium]